MPKLDGEIDWAVREMLDVEPPAGLRGRVLDRIEMSASSDFRRRLAWISVPIAVAAVVVLAMLLPWRQASEEGPRPSLAEAAPTVTVPLGESPTTPGSATTLSIPLRHAPAPRRREAPASQERMVVATMAPATDDTIGADVELEPLASIAPIAIPAVRPADITPAEIAITPLAPIAEVQIAPLSPPARRD
jgi:hypothetical protein